MRPRGYSGRESFVLVAAVLLLGGMHAAMAQGASYTLAPVGPLGLGNTAFNAFNVHGYPSHLFIGNRFQSSDEGENWTSLRALLPAEVNDALEDHDAPSKLYVSCTLGPFARSLDGGQTWQVISTPFGSCTWGWNLTQDSTGVLYLQASADKINFSMFSSIDRGTTWQQIQIVKGYKWVRYARDVHPFWADPVQPAVLYGYNHDNGRRAFVISTDRGRSWNRRENGLPHGSDGLLKSYLPFPGMTQSWVSPFTIYALGTNKDPWGYYSDDRGKHWQKIKNMSGVNGFFQLGTLRVKPGTNTVLWALAGEVGTPNVRFAESLDKGQTWAVKGSILPSEGWTQDQLCGWVCPSIVPINADFSRNIPTHLFVTKSGRIVINKSPQGLLLSRDGGNTFEVHNAGATGWSVDQIFKASDGTIYASSHDPYLWRSTDNGQTWRLCDWAPYLSLRERDGGEILGLDWGHEIWSYSQGQMAFLSGGPQVGFGYPVMEWMTSGSLQRIIIGGCIDNATFYRSDDLGATWMTLGTAPMLSGLTGISADPRNTDHLVAAGWYGPSSPAYESPYDASLGGIYCSTDGGTTSTAAMDANAIGGVTCLYRDKDNPDIMVASATGYAQPPGAQGGVFVSQDGGFTWAPRGDGLPSFKPGNSARMISAVVSPPDGPTLFAAVQLNGGLYRSADLGLTWTKIADLPSRMPDDYISCCLGDLTIRRTAVTQILPLNDGTGSFLAATMGQGIFMGTPVSAKASATR